MTTSQITITEALAELKTIGKRIEKKQQAVLQYLMRPEDKRDPLEKQGGSAQFVSSELQSIHDLQERMVSIRRAIQSANESNMIAVGGRTRSIADWLVWRREVAPVRERLLAQMRQSIDQQRNRVMQHGGSLTASMSDAKSGDVIVNLNEQELSKDIEQLEEILGTLDGQLSLKNATVTIAV